ncbi:hypothetical protein ABTE40_21140, partial [Acinetobacter baumannii]
YRLIALANEFSIGGELALSRARTIQGGSLSLHFPGNVWITTGANATGTAAEAATAFASGYSDRLLHMAPNATAPNTNGVLL